MITLTVQQLEEAENECSGYCISCGYNQPGVEPDAEGYACQECGCRAVAGPVLLVFSQHVNVIEDEDDE